MKQDERLKFWLAYLGGYLSGVLSLLFVFLVVMITMFASLDNLDLNTQHTFDLNANPGFVEALSIATNVSIENVTKPFESQIIYTGDISFELNEIYDENNCKGNALYYYPGSNDLWCNAKECVEGGFCKDSYKQDLLKKK